MLSQRVQVSKLRKCSIFLLHWLETDALVVFFNIVNSMLKDEHVTVAFLYSAKRSTARVVPSRRTGRT